jgi:hypothetical protein
MTTDDIATVDRHRLDVLMGFGKDPHLDATPPDPYPGEGVAEWSAGFEDLSQGVRVSVWFVRDPAERSAAAAKLASGGGVKVGTNGGMLFCARSVASQASEDAVSRLMELATRFAGEE